MLLSLEQLEEEPIEFSEVFAAGHIDFGSVGIAQSGPLAVSGKATLLAGEIHIQGRLRTQLDLTCARCLEPLGREVEREFDLYYHPLAESPKEEELEVPRGEEEVAFYKGDGILLDEVVKEQVLLALPMRVLCANDCQGLCPLCGGNRNREACRCRTTAADPRWDTLKKWKH